MKFAVGKPRIHEIWEHIAAEWQLETPPALGYLDPRHVTLHMISTADNNMALARTSNKINNSLFRLFRWSPDFWIDKESSFVAVWVKFSNLSLHYYNDDELHRLGSVLGNVLHVHHSTLELSNHVLILNLTSQNLSWILCVLAPRETLNMKEITLFAITAAFLGIRWDCAERKLM